MYVCVRFLFTVYVVIGYLLMNKQLFIITIYKIFTRRGTVALYSRLLLKAFFNACHTA